MTAEQKEHIAEQIRTAIDASSLTCYEISKRSGVDEGSLSRFVNRKGSLSLKSIELLAPVLGLEVVIRRKAKKKGK
jgi:transcriptional regulator with XRE-family HTH domain